MQIKGITFSDIFQIIALLVNIVIVIALAVWNIGQEERLSKLEYDEFAPRIAVYRDVILNLELDYAFYSWAIRNNGRTSAENVVLSAYANAEFPFDYCSLGVPFDNVQERISGDYVIFEDITLSPQGMITVSCRTKLGSLLAFMEKYKVSPDVIPNWNCPQAGAYDFNILRLSPNLEVIASNLEPSRISCIEDMEDILK
jgi:hypothetical protein